MFTFKHDGNEVLVNPVKRIYLASPYTHKDPKVQNARAKVITAYTAVLIARAAEDAGVEGRLVEVPFSPIAHEHPVSLTMGKPILNPWHTWMVHGLNFLVVCNELWVAELPGWENSSGVATEIAYAHAIGTPVSAIPEHDIYDAIEDFYQTSGVHATNRLAAFERDWALIEDAVKDTGEVANVK